MSATKIQYLDATWNPITGCVPGLPCWDRCWARRMSKRLAGRFGYDAKEPFRPTFHRDRLDDPLHWNKPRNIGVSFMGDIALAPPEWIDQVFAAMHLASWNTFFILTKRPELLVPYLNDPSTVGRVAEAQFKLFAHAATGPSDLVWPLPNVLIGTSVENQDAADERIPQLLKCPGRLWLSVEPLIGRTDFRHFLMDGETAWINDHNGRRPRSTYGIGWVAVGPETGPQHRPCDLENVRRVVEQCHAAGAPCFVKQLGAKPFLDGKPLRLAHPKGGDPAEWPEDLRVRQMPTMK